MKEVLKRPLGMVDRFKTNLVQLRWLLPIFILLAFTACTPYAGYGGYYPYESYYYESPSPYYCYPYYSYPQGYYYYPHFQRHEGLEEHEEHEGFEHQGFRGHYEGQGYHGPEGRH